MKLRTATPPCSVKWRLKQLLKDRKRCTLTIILILTPVMLPLNAYIASKDQQGTKLTNIQGILNRQWPNGSTEESVYATETWKRHVSAAFSCVSANVNPKLRLRKHLFPLAETWRKHAQKVVRFRCMCTRTLDHFLMYTFRSVLERAEKMFKAWYIVKFYANFATTKQLTFIGLFFRISMIGSSIAPTVEESFILLFFIGFVLSEIQQYRSSVSKVYLR